jgi:predicted ATPase
MLRAHLDAVAAGTGRLVLIGGEAGIGKTTLVSDVARAAFMCCAAAATI